MNMEEVSEEIPGDTQIMNLSRSPSDRISGDDLSDSSSSAPTSLINADNYLTMTEGGGYIMTVDELTECVERCRDLVLTTQECSEERKWLVRRLIELRYRLERVRDVNTSGPDKNETVYLGHHFTLKYEPTSFQKLRCDRCCSIIWIVVESWYQCTDCRYVCHANCLGSTARVCPHLVLSDNPFFIKTICPEKGLSFQHYECFECHERIISAYYKGLYLFGTSELEARRCDYTGKYYCPSCHWNSKSIIPARVMNNWDFNEYPVSRASLQLIKYAYSRPLINIEPRLADLIPELNIVKKIRGDFVMMKQYLSTCRIALESSELKKHLEWRKHLVHNTDLFSLSDLVDLQIGKLLPHVSEIHNDLLQHITVSCMVCRGRGYICTNCTDKNVIFPFDIGASVCAVCSHVQHKVCWLTKQYCPKCYRNQEKNKNDL